MKNRNEKIENEEDYSENDLLATELTAGNGYSSNYDSDDDKLERDSEDNNDTGMEDDELIFNDDDNEEYAGGRLANSGSAMGDNMDDDPDFTGTKDV